MEFVADTNPQCYRGIGELDLRTKMKAAWYEKQGAARDVLIIGEIDDPRPRAGEVRVRVDFSGVNPGDVKKREDGFGVGMPYPRVIPHSDGSGTVDAVGEGVPTTDCTRGIEFQSLVFSQQRFEASRALYSTLYSARRSSR